MTRVRDRSGGFLPSRAWDLLFLGLRLTVTSFFVLTSAYGLLNFSPFVFHQFIRPRIFWWVNQFVAWHHVWYCGAYALSVLTLLRDLRRPRSGDARSLLTWRLAVAFVVVFGIVAEWLVVTPYLPTLWNDRRSFIAALLSFLPIVWLAAIDHAAAWPLLSGGDTDPPERASDLSVPPPGKTRSGQSAVPSSTDPRRVLVACLLTAVYVWLVDVSRAMMRSGVKIDGSGSTLDTIWMLALDLMAALGLCAALSGIIIAAGVTRRSRTWEYILAVLLAACGIACVLLKLVFPTIAFGIWEPPVLAILAGSSLAAAWSGLAMRYAVRGAWPPGGGAFDRMMAPLVPLWSRPGGWLTLMVLPLVVFVALRAVERSDWNLLLQKTLVIVEWMVAFSVIFRLARVSPAASWSRVRTVAQPVLAMLMLMAVVRGTQQVSAWAGFPDASADVVREGPTVRDVSFDMLYDVFVRRTDDGSFSRYLQLNSSVPTTLNLPAPDVQFAQTLSKPTGPRPHVFLFVIDSLRRDYLSPFNPAVAFTPNIASFAAEAVVFQNAFTRYGGTALAVPSIWSGSLLLHRLHFPDFQRSNALEKLLDAGKYRWYMSVDTHIGPLLSPHPDAVQLDRDRSVMQFDFCRTLSELEEKLSARTDERPVFAFTLPQNLHISNRQHGSVPPGERYPGFFEPYAAEVRRIDGCYGEFMAYLKRTGMYESSVVVLTTDHGDSLGEDGSWGHGITIYPEVVRIPLMIRVPDRFRTQFRTDPGRVAFSTDITPTLYELLGHPTQDLGPLYGAPLFAPSGVELRPREEASFVLASSYAATWGVLADNGRSLYIADVVNGREHAFDLTPGLLGASIRVTREMRDRSHGQMRRQIGALAALYHYAPLE